MSPNYEEIFIALIKEFDTLADYLYKQDKNVYNEEHVNINEAIMSLEQMRLIATGFLGYNIP